MKIFLSWSGQLSHQVALSLRDWLPKVMQSLRIYVSSEDIDKGARWLKDISGELEDTSFGILCVTRENLRAPWLNFEAGALSKSIDNSKVAPFLIDLERSDVHGPILQFQSTTSDKEDFRKLIHTINSSQPDHRLERATLDEVFDVWWPKLEEKLEEIPLSISTTEIDRPKSASADKTEPILKEILELTRQQSKLLSTQDRTLALIRSGGPVQLSTIAILELIDAWTELVNSIAALDMTPEQFEVIDKKVRAGRKLINILRHPSELLGSAAMRGDSHIVGKGAAPGDILKDSNL